MTSNPSDSSAVPGRARGQLPGRGVRGFDKAAWERQIAGCRQPSSWRAGWQLLNTLGPYLLLAYVTYLSLGLSWWLTGALCVVEAAFLVRLFIIFHDCVHGSFLRSRMLNDLVGVVIGILTFTPYRYWQHEHLMHHSSAGDLARRGMGDLWTMTTQEYLQSSRWRRFCYRVVRNPLVLFLVAPLPVFVISQRFCRRLTSSRERHSVYLTNAALLGVAVACSAVIGIWTYLALQMGVMLLAGAAGMWLFYVQHQFEGVYWERGKDWDYAAAALQGSSYYELPAVLRWFSGNIGFHHIHHLSPRIPNYNLQKCHDSGLLAGKIKPLTLLSSFKCLSLRLWDERSKRLVGFHALR